MGALRSALIVGAWAIVAACGVEESPTSSTATGGSAGSAYDAGLDGPAIGGSAGASAGQAGVAGIAGSAGAAGSAGSAGTAAVVCDLGTMYPGIGVIDPDAPVYQDADWSQQDVADAFAQAKAQNTDAYLAYAAARDYGKYLDCAFCACGCAIYVGHLSALDCFKDMHGFT